MKNLREVHQRVFHHEAEISVSAPGVLNLMGEHTDFTDGYVLQMAIDKRAYFTISSRNDNVANFYSLENDDLKTVSLANVKYRKEDRWANYLKGVLYELQHMGRSFPGMDVVVYCDVPKEIGLGSSSALEVGFAYALKKAFDSSINDEQIIQSAALSERAFMGLETHLNDAFVSCLAKKDSGMFIDLKTFDYKYLPFVENDLVFLITKSNVPVVSSDSELQERKDLTALAISYLRERKKGHHLRDFKLNDIKTAFDLSESARRYIYHILSENKRVLDGLEMLQKHDLESFGRLMVRSHESLRDDYEVSCPELDWLVKRSLELPGVYGSRMTGVGFGGCTVTLCHEAAIEVFQNKLTEYERIFGFSAETYICRPDDGVK